MSNKFINRSRNRACANDRRGVAMLMVLAAIIVAAIVSYAVLSSATINMQTQVEERKSAQHSAVADDGVRLAMHYLLQPDEVDDAKLTAGLDDAVYWPGATGVKLGSDASQIALADITVTNLSAHVYEIVSMSTAADGTQQKVRSRIRAVPNKWRAYTPLQSNNITSISANTRVNGSVWSGAEFTASGLITDQTYQAGTRPDGAIGDPAPAFEELALVKAAKNGGWYTYNGESCQGDFLYSNDLTIAPFANPQNKGRVFFHTDSSPLNLNLLSPNFSGTIVVVNSDIHVKNASAYITPLPGLPGLIVKGKIWFDNDRELRVNGLLYFGDTLKGGNTGSTLRVTGAILHSGPANGFLESSDSFNGRVYAIWDATNADVPGLLSSDAGYRSLTVETWDRE